MSPPLKSGYNKGKELIARAIHSRSRRSTRAFVRINCPAVPPSLIASELFGHEKGAFTGAVQRRLGRFELANGGLFPGRGRGTAARDSYHPVASAPGARIRTHWRCLTDFGRCPSAGSYEPRPERYYCCRNTSAGFFLQAECFSDPDTRAPRTNAMRKRPKNESRR